MSSFTVPYEGGHRVACSVCPWYADEAASAIVAEGRGAHHDRAWHPEGDLLARSIENAAMTLHGEPRVRTHRHGPQCSRESCGIVRFKCADENKCTKKLLLGYEPTDCEGHLPPSREDLVAATLRRKGKS